MAGAPLADELASALRCDAGSALQALGLSERLRTQRGSAEVTRVVLAGPLGLPQATWGARFLEALRFAAEHSAEFVSFENQGGYWQLLELLSDGKSLPPPQRSAFYAQFDEDGLFSLLLGALATRGPCELPVRGCVRNLARSPDLRRPLVAAVPALVQGLSDADLGPQSAAALCNVACHSDAKEAAVQQGAVRRLVVALREELEVEAAEDFVACLGVLTGGFESGLGALFDVAATDGRQETFAPLVKLLGSDAPGLRSLVIDVLGGVCAASPQFTEWLVTDSKVVSEELPNLLRAEEAPIRLAALEFSNLLVQVDRFRDIFQAAGGISAVQAILEEEPEAARFGLMAPGARELGGPRRGPQPRDLAQHLISKVLLL